MKAVPRPLQTTSMHSGTHMHMHCLLMLLSAFLSEKEHMPLPSSRARHPHHPTRNSLSDRRNSEGQERSPQVGAACMMSEAISHKNLLVQPVSYSNLYPQLSIDFKLKGDAIASMDLTASAFAFFCLIRV